MIKRFKIGESAIGGIIEVNITDNRLPFIVIHALDWDTKEVIRSDSSENLSYIQNTLYDWTSVYHADKIMDWIKSNIKE